MTPQKTWHIAKWPALAWLETVSKLVALGIGLETAVTTLLANPTFALPTGAGLAQIILLSLLSLGLVAAIFDRLADREIIAMGFVILNNLGHWGMVLAMASTTNLGNAVWQFAGLMLLGDLVKIWFIKANNFTVRDYPQRTLYVLTGVYLVGYTLILLLELF
ncbi:MAG: hypothetical protein KC445_20585 [Anaerolineales bacterium]|nr:hypothetical protein [Anaerolineales bacterium]